MLSKGRPKKLSTPKQKKIIELFHNLFSSGFHLAEIVDFLRRSALLEEVYVAEMQAGLSAGQSFSEIVSRLGFSDSVVTQLSLSELHGNLTLSLGKIETYLENLSKVKKKLIEVGTYPLMLLGFLVLIMLGLRNYLLPQLDSQNLATRLINHLPQSDFCDYAGAAFPALSGNRRRYGCCFARRSRLCGQGGKLSFL